MENIISLSCERDYYAFAYSSTSGTYVSFLNHPSFRVKGKNMLQLYQNFYSRENNESNNQTTIKLKTLYLKVSQNSFILMQADIINTNISRIINNSNINLSL